MPVTGPAETVRRWHAELAWLPGQGVCRDVLIVAEGDRFTEVLPGTPVSSGLVPPGTTRLAGLTLPGFANAHSHVFHRALRGISQRHGSGRGSFWTWRELMYQVAERLDPDSFFLLARAVFAEMAAAGVSCVGEFHYLHHQPGGTRYADPNVMGRSLVAAAAEAGLRITLLDTCYLAGGLSADGGVLPLAGPQNRFGDGSGEGWAERVAVFGGLADSARAGQPGLIGPGARLGAAIHSVRAVPPEHMGPVVTWARRNTAPLHVHLSEQVTENTACMAVYGVSPARLLFDEDALGPRTSVVHATHLAAGDLDLLARVQVTACLCPTTERDLGDGVGPVAGLAGAGCRITVGSDSQAVIDLLEEARGVEYLARLAGRARGVLGTLALMEALTESGHASLGWPDAGLIAPGAWADLVTVSLESERLAGAGAAPAEMVLFAGTTADVREVVIGGRDVVRDGAHLLVPELPEALRKAIEPLIT